MKILVTAFEPFGGENLNPADEAVQLLPAMMDGSQIVKLQVPVVFGGAIEKVTRAIDGLQPDACLLVGQAGGRTDLGVERVAININDGRIADNAGYQPVDEPIDPLGPAAYFATLPIKAIVEGIRQAGVPATVSNSAGTYVCNHLMYGVLHHIALRGLVIPAGFIHIPFLPEQVVNKPGALPSMALETVVRGLEAALRVIIAGLRKVEQM